MESIRRSAQRNLSPAYNVIHHQESIYDAIQHQENIYNVIQHQESIYDVIHLQPNTVSREYINDVIQHQLKTKTMCKAFLRGFKNTSKTF